MIDIATTRGLSQNLLYLLMAIPTGFGIVNVGAHAIHAKDSKPQVVNALTEKAPPPVDLSPVLSQLTELNMSLDALASSKPGESPDLEAIKKQMADTTEVLKGLSNITQATYQTIVQALSGTAQK